jgi:hypothetical protein
MYNRPWEEIDPELVPSIVAKVNAQLKERQFDALSTTGRRQVLPWYAEFEFIELVDTATSTPTFTRRAIYSDDQFYILNWTNGPIYTANDKGPIMVNSDMAADYVKFFFNYVRGRHGRFVIVDSIDEVNWDGNVPEKGKEAVAKIIKPTEVTNVEESGRITLLSFMVFKDSLFRANVHLERDGMVSLSDEALVIEGMPIIEDVVPDEG